MSAHHIARDETFAPPQWPDADRNRPGYLPPQTKMETTFDHTFGGVRQHMTENATQPALSLTDWRTHGSSRTGLMIPVGASPHRTWWPRTYDGTNTALWNGSLSETGGIIEVQFWYHVFGFNTDVSPRQLWGQLDIEDWNSEYRAVPILRCQRVVGSLGDGTIERKDEWTIKDDAGNDVLVHTGSVLGANENKMGEEFLSLSLNYDAFPEGSADGCTWGYHDARINDTVIDLTQFDAGRGKRTPQSDTGAGVGMKSFAGGRNWGFGVQNNTTENEPGPSGVILTRARLLHYAKAA